MAESSTRDWDATTYQRVALPHEDWARAVLDRLDLAGDETVLDAGCGSGRTTAIVTRRVPDGRVIAVDGSPSMVDGVREVLRPQDEAIVADLTRLELDERVDAVFSTAVFHWITDHDALFARMRAALRDGGRFAAQCGGEGNIDAFRRAGEEVASRDPYVSYLAGIDKLWNYAGPEETETRLRAAGFDRVRCWLEPWPVDPPEPAAFAKTVCLGAHVERLPEELRDRFVADVLATQPEPLRLDYVRLNIEAVAA
ncbi:MAG TPA: methyltransferase domain-containing protein [Solirubrobacterales bacterium]|nr:methyltransferase domain-containing protein [Solirubrobacterales bacterium]